MRHLSSIVLFAAAAAVFPASACSLQTSVEACDRLRSFSCGCFPLCQSNDASAIDRQNSSVCTDRLRAAYDTWKVCSPENGGACQSGCEFGWGECAHRYYRQLNLPVDEPCEKSESDAGS